MSIDFVLVLNLSVIIIFMNFVLNLNFVILFRLECLKIYIGNIKFICLDEYGLWWICRGFFGGEGGVIDDGFGW